MEHTYTSYKEVLCHLNAARSTGTPAIIRVPQNDLTATKKILEMDPDGIIFPMVRTAEEAKALIDMTLYPPRGSVRGPWTHAEKPLFDGNGGHAMFFRSAEAKLLMCIHAPEEHMLERAHIFEVEEQNGDFVILREL